MSNVNDPTKTDEPSGKTAVGTFADDPQRNPDRSENNDPDIFINDPDHPLRKRIKREQANDDLAI